jgi:hypothetical protein
MQTQGPCTEMQIRTDNYKLFNRPLKYPMRERNLCPHGFDFSDSLFAS